jgi:hypothetical protein
VLAESQDCSTHNLTGQNVSAFFAATSQNVFVKFSRSKIINESHSFADPFQLWPRHGATLAHSNFTSMASVIDVSNGSQSQPSLTSTDAPPQTVRHTDPATDSPTDLLATGESVGGGDCGRKVSQLGPSSPSADGAIAVHAEVADGENDVAETVRAERTFESPPSPDPTTVQEAARTTA